MNYQSLAYQYHLNWLDLTELASCIINDEARRYFLAPAGEEHYRLLADLSFQPALTLALDIGTFRGCSALALAADPKTEVVSFDLEYKVELRQIPASANIQFVVDDVLKSEYAELIQRANLIFLDADHDGVFERRLFCRLFDMKWHGWLVLDDIFLNEAMLQFWSSIYLPKEDISQHGHWSGTGLVYFPFQLHQSGVMADV